VRDLAVFGLVAAFVGVFLLGACNDPRTTCYGVEPDGEVEVLKPCPSGWKPDQTKLIKEDEFKHLEQEVKKKETRRKHV